MDSCMGLESVLEGKTDEHIGGGGVGWWGQEGHRWGDGWARQSGPRPPRWLIGFCLPWAAAEFTSQETALKRTSDVEVFVSCEIWLAFKFKLTHRLVWWIFFMPQVKMWSSQDRKHVFISVRWVGACWFSAASVWIYYQFDDPRNFQNKWDSSKSGNHITWLHHVHKQMKFWFHSNTCFQ